MLGCSEARDGHPVAPEMSRYALSSALTLPISQKADSQAACQCRRCQDAAPGVLRRCSKLSFAGCAAGGATYSLLDLMFPAITGGIIHCRCIVLRPQ